MIAILCARPKTSPKVLPCFLSGRHGVTGLRPRLEVTLYTLVPRTGQALIQLCRSLNSYKSWKGLFHRANVAKAVLPKRNSLYVI